MKTNFFICLLLGLSICITSCSKDDDTTSDLADGTLTCKIDGANYEATVGISASISNGVFAIQGGTDVGETVRVTIGTGYNGVGQYKMGGTTINFNNSGTYIGNPTNPTEACTSVGAADNSGTLNVTLDDGDFVEGTFSIELFCGSTGSTKNLTDGKFRAKIN